MKKRIFYTEAAYVFGIVIMAFATAFTEAADFGVSMVVAPAYLLHLKISQYLPFFSFGMAEYTFQAFLLILTALAVRKFKPYYLFSFVTAVIYGFALDGAMALVALIPHESFAVRVFFYVFGIVTCSLSVAMFFRTYIASEVYELAVMEVCNTYGFPMSKFKTAYDITSCIIAVIMSFAFFGMWHFEGVKFGTVICSLLNGFMIGKFSAFFDRHFEMKDALPLRRFFE